MLGTAQDAILIPLLLTARLPVRAWQVSEKIRALEQLDRTFALAGQPAARARARRSSRESKSSTHAAARKAHV